MEKINRINNIKIKGFKSIKEVDIELKPLNILIGANGSGKSNLIKAFEFLTKFEENKLEEFVIRNGGANKFLHCTSKITKEIIFSFSYEMGDPSQLSLFPSTMEYAFKPTVNDNLVLKPEGRRMKDVDGNYLRSPINKEWSDVRDKIFNHNILSHKIYHFHDTGKSSPVKRSSRVEDVPFLRTDAKNLAAMLYHFKNNKNKTYREIIETIRLAAPFFVDFVFNPMGEEGNQNLLLEWEHKGIEDTYFNAHDFSDGTLRFICLAVLLLQPELPPIILLDEPELGLHPHAIHLLAEMLQSAATRTQVIATTQSVTLVNQLSIDDVIVVDREAQKSTFRRLKEKELEAWFDDEYGLGDLWEKNIIGGTTS